MCIDGLADEWIYVVQHEPSTLWQSSRTLPILKPPNFPSNAKLSRISTPDKVTRMTICLQQQALTQMHPPPPVQRQLGNTSVTSHILWTVTVVLKLDLLFSQHHVHHLCLLLLSQSF